MTLGQHEGYDNYKNCEVAWISLPAWEGRWEEGRVEEGTGKGKEKREEKRRHREREITGLGPTTVKS